MACESYAESLFRNFVVTDATEADDDGEVFDEDGDENDDYMADANLTLKDYRTAFRELKELITTPKYARELATANCIDFLSILGWHLDILNPVPFMEAITI